MPKSRLTATLWMWSQRPLVWIFLLPLWGILIGAFCIGSSNLHFQTVHPSIEFPRATIERGDVLAKVLASGRQAEVKGLDLSRLHNDLIAPHVTIDPETGDRTMEVPLRERGAYDFIKQMPNITVIDLGYDSLPNEVLQSLTAVEQLKAPVGHPIELSDLLSMRQLQVLDFGHAQIKGNLETLAEFSELHTLIMSNSENVTDATLAQLARLPHLKTLVIAPIYRSGDATPTGDAVFVTDAGLRILATSPSLERLYISPHGSWTIPIDQARKLLPLVSLRRGYYNVSRAQSMPMTVFTVLMILVGLLCVHVFPLLGQPIAWTTPGALRPHLRITGILVVGTILAIAAAWWQRQAGWLAGLAASCLLVTLALVVAYVITVVLPRHPNLSAGWRNLLGLFAGLLVPGFVILPTMLPVPIDTFLSGDMPTTLSVLIILASCGGLFLFSRDVQQTPRWNAAGNVAPALALSEMRQGSFNTSYVGKRLDHSKQVHRHDGVVAAIAAAGFHGHDPARRRQLWNAGLIRTMYFIVPMLLVIYSGISAYNTDAGPSSFEFSNSVPAERTPFVVIAALFGMFCPMMPGALWKGRMPILVHESLRPLTRLTLRSDVFAVILKDTLLFLPLALVPIVMAVAFGNPQSRTPLTMAILVCLPVAVAAAAYSTTMLLILIRRTWVMVLVAMGVYLAGLVVLTAYILFERTFDRPFEAVDLIPLIGVMMLASAIIAPVAWHRWRTLEFAHLLR